MTSSKALLAAGCAIALSLAPLTGGCRRSGGERAPPASGWRTFEGSLSATGERHTLELGPARRASVLSVSGSMLLTGERGLGVGFQARAIALSDEKTGMLGRAVWTDERGDQIFSEMRGDPVASGRAVLGTITGGTGRWAGIEGEYRFDWSWVVEAGEGRVQGRAEGLRGRAHLVASAGAKEGRP